jgi:two-component system, OmpR family, sensor histidine kinase SenX3
MEPIAIWTAVAVGVGGTAIGVALGRRSLSVRMRGLETSIKRSSDALERRERSSEDQRAVQDLILSSMQEGVLLFDGGWRTAFANDALERHLGPRPSAVAQLYPASLREMITRVAERHEPATIEIERDDPLRWLRATAVPAGQDGSILLVVTDITETRRVEAVRRDFVANASHELKTPAASIRAAAETLSSIADRDPQAVPRFASQLEREAMRLSRIVADLLDLSRLESGSDLGERVRLDALAREEAERFEETAREGGRVIRLDPTESATVSGSGRDLSLMIRNLIDNALRYTQPGGHVEISVTARNDMVELAVSDDGIGIPIRDLPRVFERFYRVDRARSRETGGTGLGLSIVRHVAENHGGTVEVDSELGAGSTFTVTLPALPAQARLTSQGEGPSDATRALRSAEGAGR